MKKYNLKHSQWFVIALLAGPVLGCAWLVWRQVSGFDGQSIHQQNFERLLSTRDAAGQPALSNVVVHPHPEKTRSYIVTMELVDRDGGTHHYWFEADTPYQGASAGSENSTILQYLRDHFPNVTYKVAWWESPLWLIGLSTLATVIVLAGVWPCFVNWLVFGTWRGSERVVSDAASNLTPKPAVEPSLPRVEPLKARMRQLSSPAPAVSQKQFLAREDDYYPTQRCHSDIKNA